MAPFVGAPSLGLGVVVDLQITKKFANTKHVISKKIKKKDTKLNTSFFRRRVLSSREFDPESRADVGEPSFLPPTQEDGGSSSIADRRSACRMPVEPCVLGCIQLRTESFRARHAENAESTSGLQVTSFISF